MRDGRQGGYRELGIEGGLKDRFDWTVNGRGRAVGGRPYSGEAEGLKLKQRVLKKGK